MAFNIKNFACPFINYVLKLLAHQYRLEFISLNPLFTGIVTANIFLLGFLIAGVLADYKESEKLPWGIGNKH